MTQRERVSYQQRRVEGRGSNVEVRNTLFFAEKRGKQPMRKERKTGV